MNNIRVRIAPSPTGEDLHIGNVYTALLNFVFARKNKGKFIVRIEDTDRTRLVQGSQERILKTLHWFGLNYDEGPDIGGPYGPYIQSERLELYRHYAEDLVKKGFAYYCYCTPSDLEQMRKEQTVAGKPTLYDGRCKYNKEQRTKNPPSLKLRRAGKEQKYVIRLNVPDEGVTEFNDLIRGKVSFQNSLIDDQVLLKSDGFPTYHLAVVVDDFLMKITHVIRAEDWLSSTPKHILIYKYLGFELPVFVHTPILRNPDRSKLSKRKNPVWVSWYISQGYLPEAILNYLALMGWSMPADWQSKTDETEIFTIDEIIRYFELKDVKTVGPAFDLKKLDWINGEYIRKTKDSILTAQIFEFYDRKYSVDLIAKTTPLIKERIKKLSDYFMLCQFFFETPNDYEISLADKLTLVKEIVNSLETLNIWTANKIGENMLNLATRLKIKSPEFFMILRVAITGKKISPPLNESMEILGKDEVVKRLKKVH